jgi:hypothetical protein
MTQTFPTRLAHLVSLVDLPVAQIEQLAELARNHTRKLIKEERKPTATTARKIAGVFVASRKAKDIEDCAAWLLFGTGEAPTAESAAAGVKAAKRRGAP